jgi:hypothetical protein
MNCPEVAKIGQIGGRSFCHTAAMTTKTIPQYLKEEGQKATDNQLRTEQEAARIQPLHHGHHRRAKQTKPGIAARGQSRNQEEEKKRKTVAVVRKKPRTAEKMAAKPRKRA